MRQERQDAVDVEAKKGPRERDGARGPPHVPGLGMRGTTEHTVVAGLALRLDQIRSPIAFGFVGVKRLSHGETTRRPYCRASAG